MERNGNDLWLIKPWWIPSYEADIPLWNFITQWGRYLCINLCKLTSALKLNTAALTWQARLVLVSRLAGLTPSEVDDLQAPTISHASTPLWSPRVTGDEVNSINVYKRQPLSNIKYSGEENNHKNDDKSPGVLLRGGGKLSEIWYKIQIDIYRCNRRWRYIL